MKRSVFQLEVSCNLLNLEGALGCWPNRDGDDEDKTEYTFYLRITLHCLIFGTSGKPFTIPIEPGSKKCLQGFSCDDCSFDSLCDQLS